MRKQFTLVSTVFNERKRIDKTIEDLRNQTLQPAEIIITDAGSTDGTYEALIEWQRPFSCAYCCIAAKRL
ncbi:glycosyltransferase [Niastella yeongjuensis]|uniref:glycosyltransferase n=1 Tax=Niastella yeongjuensis TaxID=354355 RepID=UPI0026A2965C